MERQINSNNQVYALMLTGLMAAIVLAATSMFRIPVPATNGYVHLGDAMIFLSVMILGRRNGTIAGATGSALADLLGGYAHWVPWTFAIKGLMAFAFGTLLILMYSRRQETDITDSTKAKDDASLISIGMVIAMAISSLIMIAGYFIAQRIIYGNIAAPLAALPGNIAQAAAGVLIAAIVSAALKKAAPQLLSGN